MTTPRKKRKANVQKILDNPVKSNQKPLRVQKEGWLGWLSYIGFGLSFTLCILIILKLFIIILGGISCSISNYCDFHTKHALNIVSDIFSGVSDGGLIQLFLVCCFFTVPLTLAIAGICAWKSNYPVSERMKKFLLFAFLFSVILSVFGMYIDPEFEKEDFFRRNIIDRYIDVFFNYLYTQFCYLYILGLFWYIYYFYKKSQDGYQDVWLKVILFTLIPLLSIFSIYIYQALYNYFQMRMWILE